MDPNDRLTKAIRNSLLLRSINEESRYIGFTTMKIKPLAHNMLTYKNWSVHRIDM